MKIHTRVRSHPGLNITPSLALLVMLGLLAGCSPAVPTTRSLTRVTTQVESANPTSEVPTLPPDDPLETESPSVQPTPTTHENQVVVTATEPALPILQPVLRPTLSPGDWMSLPIIPTVSEAARAIYQRGIGLGRDAHAFSKVGDCQVSTDFFLVSFDLPGYYKLGEFASLQETIDWFYGSFSRSSKSMRDAMRAESLFSALFADPKACQPGEGPLACEYRLHNPSIAIISLEQTWSTHVDLDKYTRYMRQAIEYTISEGIVPILATKADNLEGDNQINRIVAQLAWEYDIPLWNFWAAVQPLPYHGLISNSPTGGKDMYHLTVGRYFDFSASGKQRSGWTMRNLTALQALDAVWRGVSEP